MAYDWVARYEFREGNSNKFWELEETSKDDTLLAKWGKIGKIAQAMREYSYYEAEKLVHAKLRKGYVKVRQRTAPVKTMKLEDNGRLSKIMD